MPASKTIEIQSPLYGLEAVQLLPATASWTALTSASRATPPP